MCTALFSCASIVNFRLILTVLNYVPYHKEAELDSTGKPVLANTGTFQYLGYVVGLYFI